MTKKWAYYNEHDKFAAEWIRNLIRAGHVADGEVDERSIEDVLPTDVRSFAQCHWFAGIAGWSLALRMAGWDDARPVWTGSCPCQPFSVAGKGDGHADERHLWPEWFRLIRECRPATVFGEQVEAAIGHGWLDLVCTDLEGQGYAVGPVVLPAAGVGAPHIRQRLWFVADAASQRFGEGGQREPRSAQRPGDCGESGGVADAAQRGFGIDRSAPRQSGHASLSNAVGGVGDTICTRLEGLSGDGDSTRRWEIEAGSDAEDGEPCWLEHAGSIGRNGREATAPGYDDDRAASERAQSEYEHCIASAHRLHQHGAGQTNGHWRNADWLWCRDGKWRPVEPGTFPLGHGLSERVGRLRGYGNAIVPQVAAQMIAAYMDIRAAA